MGAAQLLFMIFSRPKRPYAQVLASIYFIKHNERLIIPIPDLTRWLDGIAATDGGWSK
jgi:hypothetical protein